MEKNIKLYTLAVLSFLCILSLSAQLDGIIGESVYILSFVFPVGGVLFVTRKDGTKGGAQLFKFQTKYLGLLLPTAAPILLSIFALSYVTALLIFGLTGEQNPAPTTGILLYDILRFAVAPAVLEEALFRYLPLKLIAPYSKKTAVLISTVFFAFAHASLFSIPYAALAGVMFILLDIISESVLPSVFLHLANNLISILWEYSVEGSTGSTVLAVFAAAAAISTVFIIIMRKKYVTAVKERFTKTDKATMPIFTAALIIPTLAIAVLELI